MSLTLVVLFAAVLGRGLALGFALTRDELVIRRRSGLLGKELRRRVRCVAHREVSGAMSFPEPREVRTLVWRVAGVPVWREMSSIALPHGTEVRVAAVRASDFDAAFSSKFRVDPTVRFELTLA